MKKSFVALLVVIVALCFPITAFAAATEHDLSTQGDLVITASNVNPDGYHVYQSVGGTTNSIILVETGVTTNITLDNVNITAESKSAIDVQGNADVTIHVQGTNIVSAPDDEEMDDTYAALHVGAGSVTITGSNSAVDTLTLTNEDSEGAVIGSNEYEDFTGSIHITGSVTVNAGSSDGTADGAAIGSGQDSNMDGLIRIDGNAVVNAVAQDRGAGIGAGEGDPGGAVNGTILIGGNAVVYAETNDDSAGIGSGENGSGISSTGRIIIQDNARVTAVGDGQGAGIGAADDSDMAGLILIRDRAQVVAVSGSSTGAAIGADGNGSMTGSIQFLGAARITTYEGKDDWMSGVAGPGRIGNGDMGKGTGSILVSQGAWINDVSGSNPDALRTLGIFNAGPITTVANNLIGGSSGGEGISMEQQAREREKLYKRIWDEALYHLSRAEEGDEVEVYAKDFDTMPASVLDALRKKTGVTLYIRWKGTDLRIPSDNVPKNGGAEVRLIELVPDYPAIKDSLGSVQRQETVAPALG